MWRHGGSCAWETLCGVIIRVMQEDWDIIICECDLDWLKTVY
jgi:hypothetical protein